MQHKKYNLIPVFCLIILFSLLFACQAETRATATAEPEPTIDSGSSSDPEPTAATNVETIIAESENGLLINEDVERSMMFRLNSLPYELPGMDKVEIPNITYAYYGDQPLTMDVYYPPDTPADAQLPVVIIGLGYKMSQIPLREHYANTSWGKLLAAAGMVAISYDTEQPDQDLEILMTFIQENAAALRIDPAQIGFFCKKAGPGFNLPSTTMPSPSPRTANMPISSPKA
jgi:hypothetical protein